MDDNMNNPLPQYSPNLVGIVRALDAAEMAVRSTLWHFDDHAMSPDDPMKDPESLASWASQNVEALGKSLPALRQLFHQMVSAETPGIEIERNRLGDACPPPFVQAVFDPMEATIVRHLPASDIAIAALPTLPESVKAQTGDSRVVYWDGEVYVIPRDVPDSFVEVWFRRGTGYWDDGGAHPLRLEQRSYGWQAFGIER